MPYYHCTKCHHEFEYPNSVDNPNCDWCGAPSIILEEETPLEKMCKEILTTGVNKYFKVRSKK